MKRSPTEADRVRGDELRTVLRLCDQLDPDAAWVIIKGKMQGSTVVQVYSGSNFGDGKAIAEVMETAAGIVSSREPDEEGKDRLG